MSKFPNKKYFLLAADVLLIPGMFLCEKLSDLMLSQYSECAWLRFGGKCLTCGGTHFVNSVLNGQIAQAFNHNQFLFVLLLAMIAVYVLLHLDWLFSVKWAHKCLRWIFSIPSLIFWIVLALGFFFVRNIPAFINIARLIAQLNGG